MRVRRALAAAVLVTAVCAGCSDGWQPLAAAPSSPAPASPSDSAGPGQSPSQSQSPSPRPVGTTIAVTDGGRLGQILVDGKGRTLYLSDGDSSTRSTCYQDCASDWPAVTTPGAPVPGSGADWGLLGTSVRKDGSVQVLYKGHPLYYYAGDSGSGDASGEGLSQYDSHWYAVNPTGDLVQGG